MEDYEELIDQDIRDEVANMSPRQIEGELAVIKTELQQEKDRATAIEEDKAVDAIWKSAKVGTVLSLTEEDTLDGLIKVGADPDKATKWILTLRGSGIDSTDFNPKNAVEGHRLYPDTHYREEATKQLKNDYVRGIITNNPELPIELIQELSSATTKSQAAMLFAKYGSDLKEAVIDETNAYLLEQSQSFDLPLKLRAKIAGVSARNIEYAKQKVSSLIRNFKG